MTMDLLPNKERTRLRKKYVERNGNPPDERSETWKKFVLEHADEKYKRQLVGS